MMGGSEDDCTLHEPVYRRHHVEHVDIDCSCMTTYTMCPGILRDLRRFVAAVECECGPSRLSLRYAPKGKRYALSSRKMTAAVVLFSEKYRDV
jgi:hypothetical protein